MPGPGHISWWRTEATTAMPCANSSAAVASALVSPSDATASRGEGASQNRGEDEDGHVFTGIVVQVGRHQWTAKTATQCHAVARAAVVEYEVG